MVDKTRMDGADDISGLGLVRSLSRSLRLQAEALVQDVEHNRHYDKGATEAILKISQAAAKLADLGDLGEGDFQQEAPSISDDEVATLYAQIEERIEQRAAERAAIRRAPDQESTCAQCGAPVGSAGAA